MFCFNVSSLLSHTPEFFLHLTSLPKKHSKLLICLTSTLSPSKKPFTYLYIEIGLSPLQKWTKCPPKTYYKSGKSVPQNPTVFNHSLSFACCSITHHFLWYLTPSSPFPSHTLVHLIISFYPSVYFWRRSPKLSTLPLQQRAWKIFGQTFLKHVIYVEGYHMDGSTNPSFIKKNSKGDIVEGNPRTVSIDLSSRIVFA